MKKHGHYCKVCGEYKANEKFSGKGHASHICKSCASLPAEKQAELMTLNRLLNLPWRLSKEQLSWLKNRLKDRRPDVRALAQEQYEMRFPPRHLEDDEFNFFDEESFTVLFSAAFTIVGLPHGILIGLVSGFSNLIPYFGAVMAFFLAVLAGLFSGAPMKAVYASVLILLLQQVDSIFIVPKAVGQKLELHPVLVLLSLAAFGRMFGFWGLVFAVPLGALCKNFVLWCYRRKKSDICQ